MYSFGKTPPRALDSFGVAGLLSDQSKIFYCSLFSTRHIGRISDLISARLQAENLDELRLRALLLFGSFEVFRAKVSTPEQASKHRLDEPLVVECGVDEDKIGIGISFTVSEQQFPQLEGLSERVAQGTTENAFEATLREIHSQADGLVIRAQLDIRRIEVVALLGIPGKIDPSALAQKQLPEIVLVEASKATDSPKVEAYIELGDLDYPQLLQDNAPGMKTPTSSTGEVLVHGARDLDEAIRVAGRKEDADRWSQKVHGSADEANDEATHVRGGPQLSDHSSIRVSGGDHGDGTSDGSGMDLRHVNSVELREDDPGFAEKLAKMKRFSGDNPDEFSLAEAPEEQPEDESEEEEDENEEDEDSERRGGIFGKLKSAWPFKQKEEQEQEEQEEDEAADESEEEQEEDEEQQEHKAKKNRHSAKPKKKKEPEKEDGDEEDSDGSEAFNDYDDEIDEEKELKAPDVQEVSTEEVVKAGDELETEISTGIDQSVDKTKADLDEMADPKAKRWADGLMSELVAEKAKLLESAKKLNASVRQKEIEFRNKEQTLLKEIRRREEIIKQKNHAITRAKEQVVQVSKAADDYKSGKAGPSPQDLITKQRLTQAEKVLKISKLDNAKLKEKIEEMKVELSSRGGGSGKRETVPLDVLALQTKCDRAVKQTEELKKMNQILSDKLTEVKRERTGAGSVEDLKKKLDSSQKAIATHQREAERLAVKLEETQKEQLRLSAENNKINNELKTLKASNKAGAKGGGPAGTAPPKAA
ncbi:hypothetical protein WDW37_04905 [Bdellovibrionota bacterium FG-1]